MIIGYEDDFVIIKCNKCGKEEKIFTISPLTEAGKSYCFKCLLEIKDR